MEALAAVAGIQQELLCPLCKSPLKDPQTFRTSCGHTFCRECVTNTLEGPGIVKSQCPTCKQPGWKKDLQTNHKYTAIAEATSLLSEVVKQEFLAGFGLGLPDLFGAAAAAAAPQNPAANQPAAAAAGQTAQMAEQEAKCHTTGALGAAAHAEQPAQLSANADEGHATEEPRVAASPVDDDAPACEAAERVDKFCAEETQGSMQGPAAAAPVAAAGNPAATNTQLAAQQQTLVAHMHDCMDRQQQARCQEDQQHQRHQPLLQRDNQEPVLPDLQQQPVLQSFNEQLPGSTHWQFQQLLVSMLHDASIHKQQQCSPCGLAEHASESHAVRQQQHQQHPAVQLPVSFHAALEQLPPPSGMIVQQLQQDMACIDVLLVQIGAALAGQHQQKQQQDHASASLQELCQQPQGQHKLDAGVEDAVAAVAESTGAQADQNNVQNVYLVLDSQRAGRCSVGPTQPYSMIEQLQGQPSSCMADLPAAAGLNADQGMHPMADEAAAAAVALVHNKRRCHRISQRSGRGVSCNQRSGGRGAAASGAGCAVSARQLHARSGCGFRCSLDGAFDTAIAALRATSQQDEKATTPAAQQQQQHDIALADAHQQHDCDLQQHQVGQLSLQGQQANSPQPLQHELQQTEQLRWRQTRSTSRQPIPNQPGRRSSRVAAVSAAAAAADGCEPVVANTNSGSGQQQRSTAWNVQELPDDAMMQAIPFALLGCSIEVFWPADKEYYLGQVVDYDPKTEKFIVKYPEDGDMEHLALLRDAKWRFAAPQNAEELQKQQEWQNGPARILAAAHAGSQSAAAAACAVDAVVAARRSSDGAGADGACSEGNRMHGGSAVKALSQHLTLQDHQQQQQAPNSPLQQQRTAKQANCPAPAALWHQQQQELAKTTHHSNLAHQIRAKQPQVPLEQGPHKLGQQCNQRRPGRPKSHAERSGDHGAGSSSLRASNVTSDGENERIPSNESLSGQDAAAAAGKSHHLNNKQRQQQQCSRHPAHQQGVHAYAQPRYQQQRQQQTRLPRQQLPLPAASPGSQGFASHQHKPSSKHPALHERRASKVATVVSDAFSGSSSSLCGSDVTSGGESDFTPSHEAISNDEAGDADGLGNFEVDLFCESDCEVAVVSRLQEEQGEKLKQAEKCRRRSRLAPGLEQQQQQQRRRPNGKHKQQQETWPHRKQRCPAAARQQPKQLHQLHAFVASESDDDANVPHQQQQQQHMQRQRSRLANKQQQLLQQQQRQWEQQRRQEQEEAWQVLVAQQQQQHRADKSSSGHDDDSGTEQPSSDLEPAGETQGLHANCLDQEQLLPQQAAQFKVQGKQQCGMQPLLSQEVDDLFLRSPVFEQQQQHQTARIEPGSTRDHQPETAAIAHLDTTEGKVPQTYPHQQRQGECSPCHAPNDEAALPMKTATVGKELTTMSATAAIGQLRTMLNENTVAAAKQQQHNSADAGAAALWQAQPPAAATARPGAFLDAQAVHAQDPCLPYTCGLEAAAVHSNHPVLQQIPANTIAGAVPRAANSASREAAPCIAAAAGGGIHLNTNRLCAPAPAMVGGAPDSGGRYCDLLSDSELTSSSSGGSNDTEGDVVAQQQDKTAGQQRQHTQHVAGNSTVVALFGDVVAGGVSGYMHDMSLAHRQPLGETVRQDGAQPCTLTAAKLAAAEPAAAAPAAGSMEGMRAAAPAAGASNALAVAAAAAIAAAFPSDARIEPMVMLCGYDKLDIRSYRVQLKQLGARWADKVDCKYTSCVVTPVDADGRTHYNGGTTMLKALLYKVPVVQHTWLVDSLSAGQLMPFSAKYLLQGFCTATGCVFDGGPARSFRARYTKQQCGLFDGLVVITVALQPAQLISMQALAALVKLGGASYVATAQVEMVAAAGRRKPSQVHVAINKPLTGAHNPRHCSRILVLAGGDGMPPLVKAELLHTWCGAEVLRMVYVIDSICSYELLDTAGYRL